MKKYFLSVFAISLVFTAIAQRASFVKKADGIVVYSADKKIKAVELKVIGSNIIKVVSSAGTVIKPDTSFVVVAPPAAAAFTINEDAASVSVITTAIKAVVAKQTGLVSFFTKQGMPITKETAKTIVPSWLENRKMSNTVMQQFASPADEALYGLGQHQEGIMNYKNTNLTLYQNNTEVFIPFLVSNKNYGILWDNYSITNFGDGRFFKDLDFFRLFDKNDKEGNLSATYLSKTDSNTIFTERKEATIDYADLDLIKRLPEAFKLQDGKAVWEGYVLPDTTGDYVFKLWSGGYLKMWVDGKLLANRWRQCWNPFTAYVMAPLVKGKKAAIKIEWIPDGGESYVSVQVMEPVTAQQKKIYQFQSEVGDNINYYFVYGKTYDDVIGGYRVLTGKTPWYPSGHWVSGKAGNGIKHRTIC